MATTDPGRAALAVWRFAPSLVLPSFPMVGLREWSGLVPMALLAMACGGETDGSGGVPICAGSFSPCGGDLVGRWESVDTCFGERTQPVSPSCPGSTLTVESYAGSGSLEFRADGTMTKTGKESSASSVAVPTECVGTCDALKNALAANTEPGVEWTAACSESGGICRCNVSSRVDTTTIETYVVKGLTLADHG